MPDGRISHFLLKEELGRGAYGTVFRGVHVNEPDYQVAVKLMHGILSGDPEFLKGIRKERQILMSLVHPGIVQCRDLVFQDNQIALVLEYLQGQTLRELLQQHDEVPVAQVQSVVHQVLDTLAYTHGRQPAIVHRDLKPSNIFLTADGTVKLLDFGLAKAAESSQASQTGQLSGTWDYMAPEVWDGEAAVPATDLYAVGLIAWELLAGRPACSGRTLPQRMKWHLNMPLPDICESRPDTPPQLASLILQLTHKDPTQRVVTGRPPPFSRRPLTVTPVDPEPPVAVDSVPVQQPATAAGVGAPAPDDGGGKRLLLRLSFAAAAVMVAAVGMGVAGMAIATDGFTRPLLSSVDGAEPDEGEQEGASGVLKGVSGSESKDPLAGRTEPETPVSCDDASATGAFEAGAAAWSGCDWAAAVQHYEDGAADLGAQPATVQRCVHERIQAVEPHREYLAQVAELRERGKCHASLAVLRQDAEGFEAQGECVDTLVACEAAEKAARQQEVLASEERLRTLLTGVATNVHFNSAAGGWVWDISVEADWQSMLLALQNYTQYPNLAMQTVQTLTYVCSAIGRESSQTQWRSRNVLFRQSKSESCIARMSTSSCRHVARIQQQSHEKDPVEVYAAVMERLKECN